MFTAGLPVLEVDRFFAAPTDRRQREQDAQRDAVQRMVLNCERVRPHLRSPETLEHFLSLQRDPGGVRRRISLALAMEAPQVDRLYGQISQRELETFRTIAQRKLAAVIWVFS